MQHQPHSINLRSLLLVLIIVMLGAVSCTNKHEEEVNNYNNLAYKFHYRNLDSIYHYASKAYTLAQNYEDGRAEALNHIAFIHIARMQYDQAYDRLMEVSSITNSQIELFIAEVQLMRLCQRQSKNKDFYTYRESALRRLERISEERHYLSERQHRRMIYGESELHIVSSTYYYYVGLREQSYAELLRLRAFDQLQSDTAQMMNYLYNVGAGGINPVGASADKLLNRELDYLFRCYMLAVQFDYPYWKANSLQAISEKISHHPEADAIIAENKTSFSFINEANVETELLAGNLAQRALHLFKSYGDVYQTSGAYRTLATCYWDIADYESALFCLQTALKRDTIINRSPDLVASICEQLCLVYSAMDNKPLSDFYRNKYLDIQEQTRQDKQLEARAEQLSQLSQQQNLIIFFVVMMLVALGVLLVVLTYLRKRQDKRNSVSQLLEPLGRWEKQYAKRIALQEESYEELLEQTEISKLLLIENKKKNVEKRSKVAFVHSVTPFIDRMKNEVYRLRLSSESEKVRSERLNYIKELTDSIHAYNDVLTHWIEMKRGELSLKTETFSLQSLFDIVAKGKMEFTRRQITLDVQPTELTIKADRVLTLFMINTLLDNARKFTSEGGRVDLSAKDDGEGYVDITISDTGVGMTQEEIAHLFEHRLVNSTSQETQISHGFGLKNCKGIIEKYKKVSRIFSACSLEVTSEKGKGSAFTIKLPNGVKRMLCFLVAFILSFPLMASDSTLTDLKALKHKTKNITNKIYEDQYLKKADGLTDSAYFSNLNGHYEKALEYADSCLSNLNKYYRLMNPRGKSLLEGFSENTSMPAEVLWFYDGFDINYNIILDIRNESAIAALALHRWDLYHYNNGIYTRLLKEYSTDNTLSDYCAALQRSESDKSIGIILLIILLLSLFPAYYIFYYRHILYYRVNVEWVNRVNAIVLNEDKPQKKLQDINAMLNNNSGLFKEERYAKLYKVVEKIKKVLTHSVDIEERQQVNYEMAADVLKKHEYESDRFHINNSILDNCLSSLKHETMYYPSRIRQIVTEPEVDIDSLTELVDYYKDLYGALSEQALMQCNHLKFQCKAVAMDEVLVNWKLPNEEKLYVMGDGDLLRFLFALLKKHLTPYHPVLTIETKERPYMAVVLTLEGEVFDNHACRNLFSSTTPILDLFVCRHILREIGEMTNARGCGIHAYNKQGNTHIEIILYKKN